MGAEHAFTPLAVRDPEGVPGGLRAGGHGFQVVAAGAVAGLHRESLHHPPRAVSTDLLATSVQVYGTDAMAMFAMRKNGTAVIGLSSPLDSTSYGTVVGHPENSRIPGAVHASAACAHVCADAITLTPN